MRHKQAVTYYVKSSEFCNFTDSLQNPQNNTYDITSKIHKKLHHFLTPCHVFFIRSKLLYNYKYISTLNYSCWKKRICFASFCNEVFNLIFRQHKILTLVTEYRPSKHSPSGILYLRMRTIWKYCIMGQVSTEALANVYNRNAKISVINHVIA